VHARPAAAALALLALTLAGCLGGAPAPLAPSADVPAYSPGAAPAAPEPSPLDSAAVEACARGAPLPPCNLWASRPPVGGGNEVHVAVNPQDPLHLLVVAKDYGLGPNGDCRPSGALHVASASYATFDGGQTWHVGRVPAPYPNGGAEPSPLPWKCGSDPVAAFGPDGTAYYILLNFQYTGGRKASIAVARSPDGGITWPAEDIRVLHTSSGDDKQWGTVDRQSRVHVVWYDSGRIWYSRSTSDYVFAAPKQLATGGSGNPAVEVATGPADEVYVTWRDGSNIRFTRSLDGGATFQPIRIAFAVQPYESGGPPRLPFMPHLAVDKNPDSPFAGRVYLTWPDRRMGDSAIYMASSGDGGATWTQAVRVDDNPLAAKRQVMPAIGIAPNGRVDIAWLDERESTPSHGLLDRLTETGALWSLYAAHSADGGATWSANRKVSEAPLVSAWSLHQDGSVFIGDYIGLASTNAYAWPSWPANGAERLALGLPADKFARADAYIAPVGLGSLLPAPGAVGPVGTLASIPAVDPPLEAHEAVFLD
jgi:hypothetical protein